MYTERVSSVWKAPFSRWASKSKSKTMRSYALAYDMWDNVVGQTQDPVIASTSNAVATRLVYHTWSSVGILRVILPREHILPKLFKRAPAVTRSERIFVWASLHLFGHRPDHSCPSSSLMSPEKVVWCRVGSRYVEGRWGFTKIPRH